MRHLTIGLTVFLIGGCGIAGVFSRNVVARAGDHVLTVDWFAETLAEGEVVLRPAIIERWAWTWVQYSLFLQRLAEGDSLLDSATVVEAMWPEVMIAMVDALDDQLVAEHVMVDSATVDSAYAAGDHRVIDHILVRARSDLPPSERAAQRRRAASIRARLAAGASWAEESRNSDDVETRSIGGRLGIIARGATVPEFELAAFALDPGELSELVETPYGYHIIRRPTLDEVWDEYAAQIDEVVMQQWKDDYLQEVSERRQMMLTDDGPDIIRDASARPFRVLALEPGRVIGSYEGGRLTDVGFVRWLQVLPTHEHEAIEGASDEELRDLARRCMQNDMMYVEAREAGVQLDEEEYLRIKDMLARNLTNLRRSMRADSALVSAATVEERRLVAREVLDEYIVRTASTLRNMDLVPPFLAAKLRAESDWDFSYRGLNRAIELAVQLRAARDSTEGQR